MIEPEWLRKNQYADDSKLLARVRLHELFSTNSYPLHRWVLDHLNLPSSGLILDLGCGPGTLWAENIDRVNPHSSIIASDLSEGMTSTAKSTLRDLPCPVSFLVADAQSIPLIDGCVDVVVANHMLYHVPDVGFALKEIHRVLKANGLLLAATDGVAHLRELKDLTEEVVERGLGHLEERFSLDHAPSLLENLYGDIRVRRYEDSLIVTEVQPLLDYVLSTSPVLGPGAVLRLQERGQEQIDRDGAIHIGKDVGLVSGAQDVTKPTTRGQAYTAGEPILAAQGVGQMRSARLRLGFLITSPILPRWPAARHQGSLGCLGSVTETTSFGGWLSAFSKESFTG